MTASTSFRTVSAATDTAPATRADNPIPPSSVSGTTPTNTTSRGAVPAKSNTMRASLMVGSWGLMRMPVGTEAISSRVKTRMVPGGASRATASMKMTVS